MKLARRTLLAMATLLGVLSGAAGAGGQGPARRPTVTVAAANPTVTLPGGSSLSLKSLEGRPRLLHFFSGTCGHCQSDDRLLRDLAFEYADQGVVLLNIFRRPVLRRQTVGTEILTPQVPEVSDPAGTLARRYGLGQQAGTVAVDRQGRVVKRFPDGITTAVILKALRKTLASPSF